MADNHPKVTPEQRRAAAGQFERGKEVIASGNYDYGIQLMLNSCKLDPTNFTFRQALRQAQKDKYKNNGKGMTMASMRTLPTKVKLQAAVSSKNWLKVLEVGEEILSCNPWDSTALMALADVFDEWNLLSQALWSIDDARKQKPQDVAINRRLAQILEKGGNFKEAMKLWEFVRLKDPKDEEAQHKAKDLAASDTIARGKFEDAIVSDQRGGAFVPNMGDKNRATERTEEGGAPPKGGSAGDDRGGKDIAAVLAKIEANPKNANAYLHLASIHRRNDNIDKAREVLEQGLVPTGNNFEIAIELLDLSIEPFRRNLQLAEAKLQKKPDDAELKKMHARLVKEINTRELDYFRQKSERYPTEVAHRFEMGVRLLNVGQANEAVKELQALRNEARFRTQSLYYLGFAFKALNNWRLAQRNFEEALQSLVAGETTLRKEILFQLACGCATSNDFPRAIDLGCELANLDYSYKDIGTLLDDWQNRVQKA